MYERELISAFNLHQNHAKCGNNGCESSYDLNTLCENLKFNEDTWHDCYTSMMSAHDHSSSFSQIYRKSDVNSPLQPVFRHMTVSCQAN